MRGMGYWVDMGDPYITYENKYIETLWWALKQLYDKGLLYKGYTIQPYSPAAGTGLSNHELNQPGCYRDVKDTTCTAQFKVVGEDGVYFLAWTTTPWTLPSNTALAVGSEVEYVRVRCKNPYSGAEQVVILAKELVGSYFAKIEHEIVGKPMKGKDLEGMRYEQLLPWVRPMGDAFRVIVADFVTTTDGVFDFESGDLGKEGWKILEGDNTKPVGSRDIEFHSTTRKYAKQGKFYLIEDLQPEFVRDYVDIEAYKPWAGRFVKNDYDPTPAEETLDVEIAVTLKQRGQAFKIEKHTHSYPHCWRTDKPVLYYPLDSWFIRTTAVKDRLIALNDTINWKPASTGTGRFGKWIEGLVDWNLSRSRFWGTPLPVWVTEDYSETKCIGSVAELREEVDKAVAAGIMTSNPLSEGEFDLHRPYVDDLFLVSSKGEKMRREPDLIDVWFDSGAMPYAQVHYPFEMSEADFKNVFPADFIAEGVDQTRGWFFTLHALSTMLFDSVAFRNIISNGLILDRNGNKMSKRLGNAVDPFEVMGKYGPDAVRWYLMSNSQPWDNLKFDAEGVDEVRRKFFGTLYNTYGFFALYANIDKFTGEEPQVALEKRSEIDRWIISLLNTLVAQVTEHLEDYDLTPAARLINDFVCENLSNWYVRLNRKRFWKGGMGEDKLAAYQTLHTCLKTVAQLMAPFAPFYAERLYADLGGKDSVHLAMFPESSPQAVDRELEEMMDVAQRVSSMVLSLRRKVNIKVRQPLSRVMIPVLDERLKRHIEGVSDLIKNEVNVKNIELLNDPTAITKRIKPDFKKLGARFGAHMKALAAAVAAWSQEDIARLEASGSATIMAGEEALTVTVDDFEITPEDMPGFLVANDGRLTVALDITLTESLRREGVARELINRIQNLRKNSGYEVTDRVEIELSMETPITSGCADPLEDVLTDFGDYIKIQTLSNNIRLVETAQGEHIIENEDVGDGLIIRIGVTKN